MPTSGRALVAGIDVVAHPAQAKQVIGVVPQTNTLDRALTVWENLYFHGLFFGMKRREARAAADEALVTFRLADRAKAPVGALSGGMAQRLMVARAILHHPSVLFLDEPTAGLDPQSRLALWDILAKLRAEGPTIFLSTHNMEEADEHCDRVAIMDHGHLLAVDTPSGLKDTVGADSIVTVSATGRPRFARPAPGRHRRRPSRHTDRWNGTASRERGAGGAAAGDRRLPRSRGIP